MANFSQCGFSRDPLSGISPATFQGLLAALVLVGCSGGAELLLPGDGEPANIEVDTGNLQSGRVGEPLSDPLVFVVTDSHGRPVEGARIVFELASGAGMDVVPDTAQTDANGRAEVTVVLGTTIGAQAGEARVLMREGSTEPTANFTATALPENANGLVAISGDEQSGPAGSTLSQPLVVQVTDAFGNPISGVPISWTAEGGGSVSEASNVTDGDGRASVQRTLGPAAGLQSTLASSEGLAGSPVTFVHTATPGNASSLTLVSGDDQTAQAGTRLPADLVVRLVDAGGNGIPGAAVTWVVSTGGGSVTPENGSTDEAGQASAQWTLGPNPGSNRLDAVVSGVGVVTFQATGLPGAPATLAITTQPSASARTGQPLGRQPVVQVRDHLGNNVATAGISITAQLSGGGGEVLGTRQRVTDGSGRATFTDLAISGAEGERVLVFTASGYAGVRSNPISVSAIGTNTTITSDSPDPSTAGQSVVVGFTVTAERVTPTGSVTVTDGSASCTGALSGGSGSCSLTLTNVGQRTIRATYSGAPGLNGSSDTEPHRVEAVAPPPAAPTSTTITSDNPDPSAQGATITVSFTVTSSSGTPTGTVRVSETNGGQCTGEAPSGSCQLVPGGTGPRNITAVYEGNASFLTSSDTEEHTVTPSPPPPPDNEAPDADYNWHCEGLTCEFTDRSEDDDGRVVAWSWTFGDGGTSNQQNPTHTFPAPGEYEVTLTVTDDDGATDQAIAHPDVEAPPPPPPGDTDTDITGDTPDPSIPGQQVTVSWTVTASSGSPSGTVVVTDPQGGTCSGSAPSGSCSYTPGGTGTRTITATYQGSPSHRGSSGTADHTVSTPNQAPVAEFSWDCDDLECDFDNDSRDPDGSIQTVSWSFGDGGTTTEFDPDHEYASAGTYPVTLTVTDDDGATHTRTHQVSVAGSPPPTAQFSWSCEFLECDFEDRSTDDDGIDSRSWNFGDPDSGEENTSDNNNPDHTFSAPGTYTVRLTVTDDDGVTDSADSTITVSAPPDESPTAVIGLISCTGMNCSFTDASTDPNGTETIDQWRWIFGDGEESDQRNPTHRYPSADNYTVMLTVTDESGLSDDTQQELTVQELPDQDDDGGDGGIGSDDLIAGRDHS